MNRHGTATIKRNCRRKRKPAVIPEGAKWCCRCRRAKPVGEFHANRAKPDGRASECKGCKRAEGCCNVESGRTREWKRARMQDPARHATAIEATNRWRESDRGREWKRRYLASPLGKLINLRCSARGRARRAAREDVRARQLARVEMLTTEILRLKERQAC